MTKVRVFLFVLGILIVGFVGIFVSYFARGYKLDFKTFKFQPNGILVVKSEPDGASVFINGELKAATNANISIPPGTYDIEVKKEGFFNWYKRMQIDKEIVTQANISLFKNVPSLSPVTFAGAANPTLSPDGTKIAFVIPPSKDVTSDKVGLWTIETFSLPLGFSNGPKRITDGDLGNASYTFSPDGRQILLTISQSIFVIDSGSFTSQNQRINVASKKNSILESWQKDKEAKNQSLIRGLPSEFGDILTRKVSDFVFSPDGNMVLYTASSSGTLPPNLVKQLPGASTQKQERDIQPNQTYTYDIKEDRNFLVGDKTQVLRWMPNSRHLLLAQEGQVAIMDYDGTNRQTVYSGSYISPNAFPYSNTTKILILTNLGAPSSNPNLYTVTLK
jgi:WD40 repeat protein